jgi:uncharacterized Zn finger protein
MKKHKVYNVLPCPNCYGSNLELVHESLIGKLFRRHWVRCNICGSVGPDKLTRDGAVRAYNREAYRYMVKRRAEADEAANENA